MQAESGVKKPEASWLQALRKKCTDTGSLLILDEIQAGFGRTGSLWGFEPFQIEPDVLVLGKALGGGMPLGAFIADKKRMDALAEAPVLGHITTFGGHPVSCAAGLAALQVLLEEVKLQQVLAKEQMLQQKLRHPKIKSLHSAGLWMAVEFDSFDTCKKVIDIAIQKGVLTDWFLFAANCLRISPPLLISEEQLHKACSVILEACDQL